MPGFQSLSGFLHNFALAQLLTSSIRVKCSARTMHVARNAMDVKICVVFSIKKLRKNYV